MPLSVTWTADVDKALPARLQRVVAGRVLATGEVIRGRAVVNLSGERSGRRYRVPGTKTTYVASAPGEYPASRTGALRQSVRMMRVNATQVTIGTDLLYGKFLELKSPAAGGRPWLGRSASEAAPEVAKIWATPWNLKP